jgi:hypothetical protein
VQEPEEQHWEGSAPTGLLGNFLQGEDVALLWRTGGKLEELPQLVDEKQYALVSRSFSDRGEGRD